MPSNTFFITIALVKIRGVLATIHKNLPTPLNNFTYLQLVCVNLRGLGTFYVLSFRLFVMLANALGGNCKSAGTESKNMQIKCYATELAVIVTRCLDKVKYSRIVLT